MEAAVSEGWGDGAELTPRQAGECPFPQQARQIFPRASGKIISIWPGGEEASPRRSARSAKRWASHPTWPRPLPSRREGGGEAPRHPLKGGCRDWGGWRSDARKLVPSTPSESLPISR